MGRLDVAVMAGATSGMALAQVRVSVLRDRTMHVHVLTAGSVASPMTESGVDPEMKAALESAIPRREKEPR